MGTQVSTLCVARVLACARDGGGLKMGQAVGFTTARGEQPKEGRYTVSQVLATLYRAIGIDPSLTFPNTARRPVPILEDREVVRELI